MATWKLETESRFGKFFVHLRKAGDPKPDLAKTEALSSMNDAALKVLELAESNKLSEDDDSIIWRNIAYDDFDQLADEVRLATL